MSDDAINMHKRLAMGQAGAETHLKRGGKVAKYAGGGAVKKPAEVMWDESSAAQKNKLGAYPEKQAHTLINDSGQKLPYTKPAGKIATMKKGGHAKGGLTIAIVTPMKKSAGRGR
jgi:hypothetical protein